MTEEMEEAYWAFLRRPWLFSELFSSATHYADARYVRNSILRPQALLSKPYQLRHRIAVGVAIVAANAISTSAATRTRPAPLCENYRTRVFTMSKTRILAYNVLFF